MSPRRNPVRRCRLVASSVSLDSSREPAPETARQHPLQHAPEPRQRRRFSFLLLPLLAQENILNKVAPIDYVQFALLSKRARNTAKAVRYMNIKDIAGILSLGKIHVNFTKEYVSICVQDTYPSGAVRVEVTKDTNTRVNVLDPNIFAREKKWNRGELIESNLVGTFPRSQLHEAARIMLEYICFLFRVPVGRVSVNVDDIPNFSSLFVWDLLRGSCPDVQFYGTDVQNGQVDKFFKEFEVKERFALEVENDGNIMSHFDKVKNHKLLVLRNAEWMQDHHFEQLDCEYLEVRNTQITPQAVNRWLRNWMDGSETYIKVLVITSGHAVRYRFSNILDGIAFLNSNEYKSPQIGTFGSFTRTYFSEPDSGVARPSRPVATLIRADGAVAKIGKYGNELCIFMRYA